MCVGDFGMQILLKDISALPTNGIWKIFQQ